MPDDVQRKPPAAVAISFMACQGILHDRRTDTIVLLGPTCHAPITHFPAHVRMSIWAEVTGGRGEYVPQLRLLDPKDDVVWGTGAFSPARQDDPLAVMLFTFFDQPLAVPHAGRYRLVLLLNGEEVCQRSISFGPAPAKTKA